MIAGTGSYLPGKVLRNTDLEKMVDTSDEWIRTRTGIRERRIASAEEAASDLAYHAAQHALESAGLAAEELDMIIVATITPDMLFPATACMLQARLGVEEIPAFDLEAACSGFLYSISIARQFIATGVYDHILVVAAETLSKIIDWQDRNTCVIFADGAGAAVVSPSTGSRRILSDYLGADGSQAHLVGVPAGGSRHPATLETVTARQHFMKMRGNELFKRAVKLMVQATDEALRRAGVERKDLDLFIPHQANIRIIQAVAKRIELTPAQVYINVHECGNMSAASIAVGLDQAAREGRIAQGDKVLLASFGGGLTWGSILLEW